MFSMMNPTLFQGRNKKGIYFEGWYFKQVEANSGQVISFIPGVSLGKEPHGFLQVIYGTESRTWHQNYSLKDFHYQDDPWEVHVGENRFSLSGIHIDLKDIPITGELKFSDLNLFPSRPWSPGIMGPFTFVPFMECYHGIVSMNHKVQGKLFIEGHPLHFTKGKGYIEKDWGRSFPDNYIWIQGNQFIDKETSLFFSLARIPWLGSYFNGFLCFLHNRGKTYTFATYNLSKISGHSLTEKGIEISITKGKLRLDIKVKQNRTGALNAPHLGDMNRIIKESVDSDISFDLYYKKEKIAYGESAHCGSEIVGDPQTLFMKK